jgi:hypothetical protein
MCAWHGRIALGWSTPVRSPKSLDIWPIRSAEDAQSIVLVQKTDLPCACLRSDPCFVSRQQANQQKGVGSRIALPEQPTQSAITAFPASRSGPARLLCGR